MIHEPDGSASPAGPSPRPEELDASARVRIAEGASVDLARLIDGWSVPVARVDRDGRILSWNRGAAALYGLPEEAAVGRSWVEAVGEDPAREPMPAPGPATERYEARHRSQGGRALDVMVTRAELLGPGGVPDGAFLLVIDVTGSKLIEARLKRRIAQLSVIREIGEALQSAMGLTGILRTILVGATASQGLRFNRAFLLLVDGKRGELRGRVAIGPSDPDEASRVWADLSRSETTLKGLLRRYEPYFERTNTRVNEIVRGLAADLDDREHFLIRALRSEATVRVVDGRELRTSLRPEAELLDRLGVASFVAVPLIAEGKPVGLLLADNAITGKPIEDEEVGVLELLGMQAALAIERAQLSGELEIQVSSLEAATREIRANHDRLLRAERLSAIGEMAARVAHEIRNPLTAIGGFARLMLRDASVAGPMRENIQIIVSEVRRLEGILTEVLDFSNPAPLRMERVEPAPLVQAALDLLKFELDERGIEARMQADETPPALMADRDQLFQAFINLMRNAMDAMPQGGDLCWRVRSVPGAVEIALRDSGVGMAPEVRARIFEPFFTTRSTGSGLGLTIAAQIVRDHRGEIRVESEVGAGTTFFLRLPAAAEGGES